MRDFHLPGRSAVFAENGMAATSHPLASLTAIDILKTGGNAVDAAIAAALQLGILEPQMTGIGGDCFILLQPKPGADIIALNGSGRAPAALSADKLRADGYDAMPTLSADAVTIPGAIDAFCRLHSDYGQKDLSAVIAPALRAASEGVPVAPRVAFDWALAAKNLQGRARDLYLLDSKAPRAGQIYRAPGQADVLRALAKQGRAGFYEGAVAEDMVASLNALGGCHTLEDFAHTKCEYTRPIEGRYKGHRLIEHPPNGQGVTAILMNNILTHFDIASLDPFGAQRAHIEAEAAKLAYDARNRFLADADHMTRLDHLMSDALAAELAASIRPDAVIRDIQGTSEAAHRETITLSVVDQNRMSVALIYSVFHSFGSGLASNKFGINFQNRGAGFSLVEGHANEAGGGKRPMHTIIPAFLEAPDGAIMPFGVMGGAYQPNGHARFISNLVDFGMDTQRAIDAPRSFFDQGRLGVERGYSDSVRAELAALGHDVHIPDVPIGGAQAVKLRADGLLEGGSDPRKDGIALGF